jgi:hypothetical protein
MPQTIDKTFHGEIIGGAFTNARNVDKALRAFEEMGVLRSDIQVLVKSDEDQGDESYYAEILIKSGFSPSQATHYDRAVREGKILVAVYAVTDPASIIDIFDQCHAEYNPDGSRNVREDVVGLTVGAAIGAASGGAFGTAVAGPVGAGVGAAAGAVVGASAGAALGKMAEHRK